MGIRALEDILATVKKLASRPKLHRFLHCESDRRKIAACQVSLRHIIDQFQVSPDFRPGFSSSHACPNISDGSSDHRFAYTHRCTHGYDTAEGPVGCLTDMFFTNPGMRYRVVPWVSKVSSALSCTSAQPERDHDLERFICVGGRH